MTCETETKPRPAWLRDLPQGPIIGDALGKRIEHRRKTDAIAVAVGSGEPKAVPVRVMDISAGGIGLLSQIELPEEHEFQLFASKADAPDADQPVGVRVVHCRRAADGFRLGCVLLAD